MIGILETEKPLLGGDFNGHIWTTSRGYDDVNGGFSFGDRNKGVSHLDYAKAFKLVIANSSFQKREEHLVTYANVVAKTQIDYVLLGKYDRGLCKTAR